MSNQEIKTSIQEEEVVKKNEELTREELLERLNALEEAKVEKPKVMTEKERQQRANEVAFFQEAQRGAYFIKFMMEHLRRGGYNRQTRRRLISQMMNQKFSKEFVDIGIANVKAMVEYVQEQLNKDNELRKSLEPVQEPIDGETYVEELRKQEAEGTLKETDDAGI